MYVWKLVCKTPVRTPKFLNAYESLQLVKEAHTNDGTLSDFPYTEDDMIAFMRSY